MRLKRLPILSLTLLTLVFAASALTAAPVSSFRDNIYNPGELKPIDSELKVAVGEVAPDFSLPAIAGKTVRLSDYRGKSNVVLSFVPAAWTPVCSDQWPGYNLVEKQFREHQAVLLGITVDNIPTLHAWVREMGGLWFDVLSDFWPHGEVAASYGLLRGDGTAERSLIFIGKDGKIKSILVSDINVRPPLEDVFAALESFDS